MATRSFRIIPISFGSGVVALALFLVLATAAWAATTPRWLLEFENNCNAGSMKDCMNAAASWSLGKYHDKKVKPDKNKADLYKQKVMKMGTDGCNNNSNLDNCYLLGLMYFEGRAIIRDVPRGVQIVTKVCKAGHQEACNWLDDTGVY